MRRLVALTMALILPLSAHAGLIRDAEIEATIATYARPIFTAAEIDPDSVRILIVQSPEVNAFVAGGLNIFLHTGLIRETKTPGMLIGVIAHETGHIAGAHLSQFEGISSRATLGSAIGLVLGAAAAIGGQGDAAIGAVISSQQVATRGALSDIRRNEQAADQAALRYLEANDLSANGMLDMFEVLRQREQGAIRPDKYLLTHPLSSERITAMRNHINASPVREDDMPAAWNTMHARMLAKLMAFTEPYAATIARYPTSDRSVPARYARAIAEFKRSNLRDALTGINSLIAEFPNDPYFYDTKGQMLFENGNAKEAALAYARAHALAPRSPLIAAEYGKSLIALDQPASLRQAIDLLERAREGDPSYDGTWRQLAIAYGKQGKLGLSYAALAEEAALSGDFKTVIQHVARARKSAGDDASLTLQLDDLERDAKEQLKKKKQADSPF